MESQGVRLLQDMTQMATLGFGDVLRKYFDFRKIFYRALDEVQNWKPDAIVVIDSPAFNLRFAKKAAKLKPAIPLIYYIAPQLWAWGQGRIKVVQKTVSKILVILPFEADLYHEAKVPCEFVGHPIIDHIPAFAEKPDTAWREKLGVPADKKIIGLLPGSRKKEVERIFPVMVQSAALIGAEFPGCEFWIGRSSNIDKELYLNILQGTNLSVRFFETDFYRHVQAMDFALVTSGTATLETALLGTPFFLLYKASWSTYHLGKYLIKVPYLGLVNLLAQKSVVPEFIQHEAHPESIAHESIQLLNNPALIQSMKTDFKHVRTLLGEGGASRKAAQEIGRFLSA